MLPARILGKQNRHGQVVDLPAEVLPARAGKGLGAEYCGDRMLFNTILSCTDWDLGRNPNFSYFSSKVSFVTNL